jgi:hypothetical protein
LHPGELVTFMRQPQIVILIQQHIRYTDRLVVI